MTNEEENELIELRKLAAIVDCLDDTEANDCGFWNSRRFCVNCNDLFAWGCADAEELTVEDIPDFKNAQEECFGWGALLWCCRKVKMRPQGAYLASIDEEYWPLFEACGDDRPAQPGNPVASNAEAARAYNAKKAAAKAGTAIEREGL